MRDDTRKYTNGEITVYWEPDLCIHVMNCLRDLPSVFNSGKRPWVNMQAATTEEIIKAVEHCPTDALTYKWNKDLDKELTPKSDDGKQLTEIKICKNGPLLIRGEFALLDDQGCVINTPSKISLCRCGNSKNKPYCDGEHNKSGFNQ